MKHLIKIVKGEPVVSTEVIAAEFGRRHDNVMQNIRSLIESDHLGPLDFKESSYVNKQSKEAEGKEAEHYHFSNEANLINRIVLGTTAAKFRKENDIGKTEAIRDYLTAEQIRAITELQRADTVFINMGWDFVRRKAELKSLFDRNHRQPLIEEQHRLAA
ncbi:Rha family transcriptional regulator [Salmonella enterica]